MATFKLQNVNYFDQLTDKKLSISHTTPTRVCRTKKKVHDFWCFIFGCAKSKFRIRVLKWVEKPQAVKYTKTESACSFLSLYIQYSKQVVRQVTVFVLHSFELSFWEKHSKTAAALLSPLCISFLLMLLETTTPSQVTMLKFGKRTRDEVCLPSFLSISFLFSFLIQTLYLLSFFYLQFSYEIRCFSHQVSGTYPSSLKVINKSSIHKSNFTPFSVPNVKKLYTSHA